MTLAMPSLLVTGHGSSRITCISGVTITMVCTIRFARESLWMLTSNL